MHDVEQPVEHNEQAQAGRPQTASKAVVLLSGGLDSATCLAIAQEAGFACHCLSFDYGQRHRFELQASAALAVKHSATEHRVIKLDASSFAGSALTTGGDVPKGRNESEMEAEIPVTYVPARNMVFLSMALGYAEVIGARDIFIGVNAVDYSGYPDCRPAFIQAFEQTANLATKAGVESQAAGTGPAFKIHTPLIDLTKAQIVTKGTQLGVDYSMTHSCYAPSADGGACGQCDACILRAKGFKDAGLPDPTRYAQGAGNGDGA